MNLQHNLAALQAQLAMLQQENSALTRDRSLKENYIQLKDQQFRVMQRRLEELEGSVAKWKDRWLQQVNAQQATSSSGDDDTGAQAADRLEDAKWTPWKCKPGAASKAKALAQATAKLEKLSQTDRNKLQPLLAALEQSGAASTVQDLVFADVSEELSRILLLYLLPALLDAVDGAQQLQCFSRTYRKQTMDFRVCTASAAATGAVGEEPTVSTPTATAMDKLPPPVSTEPSGNSSARASQAVAETEETEAPHLFDYVELDRRGVARTPVPHGPRELHATKAMFISRPLSGSAAARAAISPLDKLGDKPLEKASRRSTLTPKRTGPTFAVETTRTHTMTMGALPSPAQSPSSMGVLPLGSDGEVIPMPPREKEAKDGKIKKIVGSVFDRLTRHKSQQSLGSNSAAGSAQASPVPLTAPAGSSEAAGDEDDSICDGCGRGPLVGAKWVCRTCRLLAGEEYELCEKCYGQGLHGKEHEDALFARVENIVVRKCPRLSSETELLHLLRIGICKANLKKFSFCLTWIADLLQCNRTTDLRARALEIAHIPPTVRSEFARLLRELLARYRPDIELRTEWEPAAGAQHSTIVPAPDELDTLRIWVKDAPLATPASTGTTSIGTPSLG